MGNHKIAFFTPTLDQKSETFIHAQIDKFKPKLLFHGGWFHNKVNNRKIVRIRHKIQWFYLSEDEIRIKLIIRILQSENIDIIIIQYFNSILDNYYWLKNLNFPLIVHFHGFDFSCYEYLNHPNLFNGLNLISGAFSVSNSMSKRIESAGFSGIIETQPCPPNIQAIEKFNLKLNSLEKRINVVFLGRFTQKKAPIINVFLIQKIIKLFLELDLNDFIHFQWIGDGEYFNVCNELINQLNLSKYVTFNRTLENMDALEIMSKSSVFIQNSIQATDGNCEGTPVALLEAGAMGLAVVASKHEGIIDVIEHGFDGYLAEPGDIESLAKHVVDLCKNKELRDLFGSELKKKIYNKYNSDIYYNKLYGLINCSIKQFNNKLT